MNHLWLMTVIALLAANVIAQDDSDEHFLNLVRRKAGDANARRTETDLSEKSEKMDDSSQDVEVSDNNFGEQERKRTSNKPTKRRCVAWSCKRRFLITREKVLSKKSQVADNKRCMSWGCKKRSLEVFKQYRTTTRNLARQKRSEDKRNMQPKRCMTRECEKEKEIPTANLKKKVSKQCIAWYCKDGKRAIKRPREIDTSKRIISRKPDDVLGLFDSSGNGKCRDLECLNKRMSKDRNADVASLSRKNKMPSGCITWDCYGKRTASKTKPAVIDTLKRIISRKNDKGLKLPGLTDDKCRGGWKCLKKRVGHVVQSDAPAKPCLSWDCDKRRADTGESTSTKTQQNMNEQFHEKDASQYGIPDEYKDMIRRPIRRDVLGRISPYFTDKESRRTLGKDI